jgi:hypothetical protein
MPLGLRALIQQVLESRLLGQLHLCLFCYLITQTDEMLSKDSLREKLFRNQVGGEGGTVPELLFEKKGLVPALQQLLVSCPTG